MGLRLNRYTFLKLYNLYQPVTVCTSFSPHTSHLLLDHNQRSYQGKLNIKIQNPIKLFKRSFALKLYSQFIPEAETLFSDNIIEYIKIKNDFHPDANIATLTNVFDSDSAIKQIQSIILHSLEAQPEDVIKLFILYKSYDQLKLQQTFKMKASSKLMGFRIQSTVLLMSCSQLHQFAIALKNITHHKVDFFRHLAQFTFEECLSRAETCESLGDVLKYFLIGLELFGNGISSRNGYSEFMSVFEKHIHEATPLQLTQFLYFMGFAKKNPKKRFSSDLPLLATKLLIPHLEEISLIDTGLAINGLFKLNLQLESDLSSIISNKIIQEIDPLTSTISLNNMKSFAFVSIIKYLRLTLFKDETLMHSMKKLINHLDDSSCNPQIVSHVLALYANSNFYDSSAYSTLGDMFFRFLRSSNEVVRIKDISRFMWAMSHAQHQCKIEDFNLIIENLYNFSNTGELLNHSSHVVDSALSLASLNVYSEKLMKTVLQADIVKSFKDRERSRYLSRLLVLHEVQKTTLPSLDIKLPAHSFDDVPQRKISTECHYRPCMKRVDDAIIWLRKECGVKIFTIRYLVPHIHYCSIVLTGRTPVGAQAASDIGKRVLESLSTLNDFKVAIDIDDKNTTLNEGTRTNGMESLKRSLLRAQGWDIKVLSATDIENCGEDDQALAALLFKTVLS